MKQTETELDNVAEHTINDYWHVDGAISFSFSAVWVGRIRFQVLRPRRQVGNKWVMCRSAQIPEVSEAEAARC